MKFNNAVQRVTSRPDSVLYRCIVRADDVISQSELFPRPRGYSGRRIDVGRIPGGHHLGSPKRGMPADDAAPVVLIEGAAPRAV